MTILGKVIGGPSPASIALKGTELILDADADTTITADTDDRIDIKIAGADDFKFTANNFNVLSGSTLTIDSGATITNSGTANNFGTDPESAYAGVLQSNANFVDQVIFGPAVDGRAWNGLWNKASVFSSLMLATIEDEGSNTEINIWDLTEQSAGAISTTPLATVDLASAATPTAVAACMGYIIVGSEDGIAIIDPHSGAWAERKSGWPRTLSSSTVPALTNNDVQDVDAGIGDQPPFDSRTGGPMPSFACAYGTGADYFSLIKHDGNVWDKAGTVSSDPLCIITSDGMVGGTRSGDLPEIAYVSISAITADDFGTWGNYTGAFLPESAWDEHGGLLAGGSSTLFTQMLLRSKAGTDHSSQAEEVVYCHTNRTYTTGYVSGDVRGAWLANSKTADRSVKSNTLTESGTVTEAAVESGAELMGYSGFSTSNYISASSDSDWNSLGTGPCCISVWFKCVGASSSNWLFGIGSTPDTLRFNVVLLNDGTIQGIDDGATGNRQVISSGTFDDSLWHKVVWLRHSSTSRELFIDGVSVGTNTDDAGSLSGTVALQIGAGAVGGTPTQANDQATISLCWLSATIPTATQIRQMYDAEKGMFVASAECLLQSGSTDAVLDVNVDPLTGKVLVTQTDAITVFDGLVVDSKPTVNSGASEKGKLWGALRSEQNAANAYVTAPAVDQRQVNEMVRGLANELPKGVDLSKAKAWVNVSNASTPVIESSFNIKSISRTSTGEVKVTFGIPFKTDKYIMGAMPEGGAEITITQSTGASTREYATLQTYNATTITNLGFSVAFFGELENE